MHLYLAAEVTHSLVYKWHVLSLRATPVVSWLYEDHVQIIPSFVTEPAEQTARRLIVTMIWLPVTRRYHHRRSTWSRGRNVNVIFSLQTADAKLSYRRINSKEKLRIQQRNVPKLKTFKYSRKGSTIYKIRQ